MNKKPLTKFLVPLFLLFVSLALANEDISEIKATRSLLINNKKVSVWKTEIPAKCELALHRHEHSRLVIALNDGELIKIDENGNEMERMIFEQGKSYWLDADPVGELHKDYNQRATPIEVIVIQLME